MAERMIVRKVNLKIKTQNIDEKGGISVAGGSKLELELQRRKSVRREHSSKNDREGIPEFMLRLARAHGVRIFETMALPKYRHD